MSMWDEFGSDEDAEKNGIWASYSDFRVRVRPANDTNKEFGAAIRKGMKPYRRLIGPNGEMSKSTEEALEKVMKIAFCKHVIVDWEGVTHPETGESLELTYENALMVMKRLPRLYKDLKSVAENDHAFSPLELVDDEDDAGN